jgi:hypothetical protein
MVSKWKSNGTRYTNKGRSKKKEAEWEWLTRKKWKLRSNHIKVRPERRKKKEEPTEKVTADNEDILTLRKEADSTRHGRSQQSRDKLPGSAVIVDDIILLLSDGPSIPFLYA